jgi:hypothetical protein
MAEIGGEGSQWAAVVSKKVMRIVDKEILMYNKYERKQK